MPVPHTRRMEPSAVARFVRDVLGCGCPEEILRSITVDRGHLVSGLDVEVTRLDVGGRLLAYVAPAPASQPLCEVVAAAIAAGTGERDRLAFNRFRFVLATDDSRALEESARAAFAACNRPDERVHLHVVDLADVPPAVLGH